jgi:hypothetical protein
VYETPLSERRPYSALDWLSGFFVVDGQRYNHMTELHVSRTDDGMTWQPAGALTLPGQPGGLWAFPVDERRIGIALAFNNLSARWFAVSRFDELTASDVQLPFMQQFGQADCFVHDARLTCVRPVLDPERQKPMLVVTSTDKVWGGPGR